MDPVLNGVAPSWSETRCSAHVDGGASIDIAVDWKAINWESKVERGEQRGASGGRILKRTTGQVSNTADAELYASGFRELVAALAAVAPKDSSGRPQVSKVSFDLQIQHAMSDSDIYETQLRGCRLDKFGGKLAEGVEANMVSIDLNPIQIIEKVNGQEVVLL